MIHSKTDFPVALTPDLDAARAMSSLTAILPSGHPDNSIAVTRRLINAAVSVGQGIFTRQANGQTLREEELTFLSALRSAGLVVTSENSIDAAIINSGGS